MIAYLPSMAAESVGEHDGCSGQRSPHRDEQRLPASEPMSVKLVTGREELIRRLILPMAIFASLAAGCGSERGSSAGTGTTANSTDTGTTVETPPLSARFVEQINHRPKGGKTTRETTRGAFDWDARKGWAEAPTPGAIVRVVQVGDLCFQRTGTSAWKRFSARKDLGGLCWATLQKWGEPVFSNPKNELPEFRDIVPEDVEVVGQEEVGGVTTTHYSLFVHESPLDEQSDLWVDESGTARRKRDNVWDSQCQCRTVTTRTWSDFGTDVNVTPPLLKTGD